MKKLSLISLMLLFCTLSFVKAATITSIANGNWNTAANWDLGRVPNATDIIVISSDITMSTNPGISFGAISIDGTSKKILNIGVGVDVTFTTMTFNAPQTVLDIYGTIRFSSISVNTNKSDINIFEGGQLFVSGNVSMTGSNQDFSVSNSGTATVGGDFLISSSTSTATISGSLSVSGTLTNNGTVTVPSGGVLNAGAYDGTGTTTSTGSGQILQNGWPLPISLTYFQVNSNKNNIVLSWQTASELNNNYFTIERSADGNNFETLANISGAGNSSDVLNYSFTDYSPLTGTSYYRLKQTDFDGKSETFDAVSVTYFNEKSIQLSPVPTTDALNVTVDGSMGKASLKIINILGAVVKEVNQLESQTSIDVSSLPKGIYILSIEGSSSRYVKQIMIK